VKEGGPNPFSDLRLSGNGDLGELMARVAADIGIPNGPAEDSTRGLLKAQIPEE
jgi:hypothetical protein